jgi:hypothetical protein
MAWQLEIWMRGAWKLWFWPEHATVSYQVKHVSMKFHANTARQPFIPWGQMLLMVLVAAQTTPGPPRPWRERFRTK